MISNWWISLVLTFLAANAALDRPAYKGRFAIAPNAPTLPTSPDGVKSLDMLNGDSYCLPFMNQGVIDAIWVIPRANISFLANRSNIDTTFPTAWIPADYLAKGLFYTVLTDLGQPDPNDTNIFANPDLLAYFASTLRIDPSVLATEYLCQVPQLKPTGSLIIAVLIADIVLLKTIWQLYKLGVDWMLQNKHPDMKLCEGCLVGHGQVDDSSAAESEIKAQSHRGDYQKIQVSERSTAFE
ncbi:hypothetical protein PRZ48_014545 [Zasmidium cellare]|uniref:Uncharacterized protein n=1 Tax=Zasmidium cellare TaxID=395010 RepID=A0ABR0DYJ6_ZASCE|nr:hypothetical protein PRZ48_014545 [Zasmidium cellare]